MFDEVSDFDMGDMLDSVTDFFDTFFTDVMNPDMVGLIKYLFSCFPAFLRTFMGVAVILAVIVTIVNVIRRD